MIVNLSDALSYVAQLDSPHGYVNTDKHEPALKLLAAEVDRLRCTLKAIGQQEECVCEGGFDRFCAACEAMSAIAEADG